MKTYRVYVGGSERGLIKAASHNAAEKKAQTKYNSKGEAEKAGCHPSLYVSVEYTEV